jgi:hypothetical protein
LAKLVRLQPGQQGQIVVSVLASVQLGQMPEQMLEQLGHYRHELPQPVLSKQANLVEHHRGCC